MRGRAYTTTDLKVMQQVAMEGGTMQDAANRLGRSYHGICQAASEYQIRFKGRGMRGPKARSVDESIVDAIRIMAAGGMKPAEIFRVVSDNHDISGSYIDKIAAGIR